MSAAPAARTYADTQAYRPGQTIGLANNDACNNIDKLKGRFLNRINEENGEESSKSDDYDRSNWGPIKKLSIENAIKSELNIDHTEKARMKKVIEKQK